MRNRILFLQCGILSLFILYFLMYNKVEFLSRRIRLNVVPVQKPLILYWTTHWGEPYPAAQVVWISKLSRIFLLSIRWVFGHPLTKRKTLHMTKTGFFRTSDPEGR